MSLEVANFISDLDPNNPGPTDLKNQGDDHLRLIKKVLQNTFPNATGPSGGSKVVIKNANYTITVADDQTTFVCDTSAGPFTLTLPVIPPTNTNWTVRIQKSTLDANPVFIVPSSGTLNGYSKIRRTVENLMTNVFWNGLNFAASRPFGAPIGTCLEFYGATLPNGFLWPDGTGFVATDFVELNSVLGGAVKPDRRGRVGVGKDDLGGSAANRVTVGGSGIAGNSLGGSGGAETITLDGTQIPSHTHPVTDPGHHHTVTPGSFSAPLGANITTVLTGTTPTNTSDAFTGITIGPSPGGGQPHSNMPPTLVANFILVAE